MSEYLSGADAISDFTIYTSPVEPTFFNTGVYQALADPKRLAILYALAKRPYHVIALAEELHMPQSTISRHLRILRQQSLVTKERDGSFITYRLADRRIIQVMEMVRQIMSNLMEKKTAVLQE